MMGGTIGVESQEGKGSTFRFTVVFKKPSEGREAQRVFSEDLREKRILVVDDNATNRRVLIEQLTPWGCHIEEAEGGQQALTMLRQAVAQARPFDVAILDMQMPEMDGEMLGRSIKAAADLKDTLLVMLTSMGQRGDAARLEEIGFAAFLTKPVKRLLLYACLTKALGIKTREQLGAPSERQLVTKPSMVDRQKRQLRILLAEDNIINQQVALHILRQFGYHTDAVANGLEAVKALEMMHYDLVLMDVQMPEMDGFAATAEIRQAQSDMRNVPIIAMTAHAMKGDRERCLQAGMNDYTSKPINPKELFEKIERWVAIEYQAAFTEQEAGHPQGLPGKSQDAAPIDMGAAMDRFMGDQELRVGDLSEGKQGLAELHIGIPMSRVCPPVGCTTCSRCPNRVWTRLALLVDIQEAPAREVYLPLSVFQQHGQDDPGHQLTPHDTGDVLSHPERQKGKGMRVVYIPSWCHPQVGQILQGPEPQDDLPEIR
jgi:CheY-like chemotaxis protein